MNKLLLALCSALSFSLTQAQVCSSDGQVSPQTLSERFISADCADCWTQVGADAAADDAQHWVLDWIVPSAQGPDAPLGAAALRDSNLRLQMLSLPTPVRSALHAAPLGLDAAKKLRVAYGLPYVNYVGSSITFQPADQGPWLAVLLLVEDLPAGTEGSPIARHLVRNMLQVEWDDPQRSVDSQRQAWYESRPMSLPEGSHYDRLRAVGWVQYQSGQIVALTRSECGAKP